MPIMNERTIAIAERALIDFIRKSQRERDYFKGRLIKADDLPAPNQHMVSAAMRKLEWYKVELMELEGELEILREELGITDTDQEEEQVGEEEKNTEHDAC
jgi:DNA-directed RNA polymerase specialized sigma24 family protein